MSTELPVAFVKEATETTIEIQPATSAWIETVVAVVFTAAGVLFVSLVAVMSGVV
ncbi:MAG: hypothetical protein P4L80_16870 [Xanthobacteraceae bacterium]|nr:hypothetical protein [Xanthobacteraceae bacterium]